MKTYEALVISPSQATAGGQDGKQLFEEAVKKHTGKILNHTDLGKRILGYPVKKVREGFLTSFTFELSPEKVDSLKGALQLADGIAKFTITRFIQKQITASAKRKKLPASHGAVKR
ncbi:MAG: 30S ribosomal protein S6 [Candidatus Omnitrophica bacterium]|nr:30S ribosomal protein S6 [Candidatus Omnitrophota bacterium]